MGKLQNSSNWIPSYEYILGYSNEDINYRGLAYHKDSKEMHFKCQNKLNHNFFNIALWEKIQKLPESS